MIMNDKTEDGFEDVSQPVPDKDRDYQRLLRNSTEMPLELPDSLTNPPNLEDLINEE